LPLRQLRVLGNKQHQSRSVITRQTLSTRSLSTVYSSTMPFSIAAASIWFENWGP